MELEIREIPNADEKTRQQNSLDSFKAELKRLQREYNQTQRRVQRFEDRRILLNSNEDDDSCFIGKIQIIIKVFSGMASIDAKFNNKCDIPGTNTGYKLNVY